MNFFEKNQNIARIVLILLALALITGLLVFWQSSIVALVMLPMYVATRHIEKQRNMSLSKVSASKDGVVKREW